jgi:hypothetical protein
MWICDSTVERILLCTSSSYVERILPCTSNFAPYIHVDINETYAQQRILSCTSSTCVPTLCHTCLCTMLTSMTTYAQQTPPLSLMETLLLSFSPCQCVPLAFTPPCCMLLFVTTLFFSPFDINGKGIFPTDCAHPESDSPYLNVVFLAAQFLVLLPLRLDRSFNNLQPVMKVMCLNEEWEGLPTSL